eukprot:5861118-Prymnesium_polylepis.1
MGSQHAGTAAPVVRLSSSAVVFSVQHAAPSWSCEYRMAATTSRDSSCVCEWHACHVTCPTPIVYRIVYPRVASSHISLLVPTCRPE